jgi:predicted phosphodiesterase
MKLLVLSDLHLNHNPYFRFQDEYPDFDVAVFAGDIAETPLRSVLAIADLPQFAGKHKVFQAGNHEYYGKHFQSENDLVLKHTIYPNTHEHYLLRRSVILDDVKFIGATVVDGLCDHRKPIYVDADCSEIYERSSTYRVRRRPHDAI